MSVLGTTIGYMVPKVAILAKPTLNEKSAIDMRTLNICIADVYVKCVLI